MLHVGRAKAEEQNNITYVLGPVICHNFMCELGPSGTFQIMLGAGHMICQSHLQEGPGMRLTILHISQF